MTPEEAKKYDQRQREEYQKRQTSDAQKRKDDTLQKAREMKSKNNPAAQKSAGVSPEFKNTRNYKAVQMEHAGNMSLVESDNTKAAATRAGELVKLRSKDKGKLSPEHAAELKMSIRHAKGRNLDKGIPEFRRSNDLRAKRESAAKIGRVKKAIGFAPKKPTAPGLAPSKKTSTETLKAMRNDTPTKKPEAQKRTL